MRLLKFDYHPNIILSNLICGQKHFYHAFMCWRCLHNPKYDEIDLANFKKQFYYYISHSWSIQDLRDH